MNGDQAGPLLQRAFDLVLPWQCLDNVLMGDKPLLCRHFANGPSGGVAISLSLLMRDEKAKIICVLQLLGRDLFHD